MTKKYIPFVTRKLVQMPNTDQLHKAKLVSENLVFFPLLKCVQSHFSHEPRAVTMKL